MSFDFGKLATSGAINQITEPSALFDALPNKDEGYGYLRAVQKTVLDAWSARRGDRDLVIKTNTGGGKTIVGLLMLQCCLNEGVGPALYLAPDPHLQARVLEEARKLGIRTVSDPEDSKFLSSEAICVTTMQILVNGKSRFGVLGSPTRQPLVVKSIVIDDAHAALALTEESTQLVIPKGHDTYQKILNLFAEDLELQGLNSFLDVKEGDRNAVLRVPFWSWSDKHDSVLEILRPHRGDEELEWSWPLISDQISTCQAVVTSESIEISPMCPPIEKFPSFAEAQRRIYLTATLADDSVLVTHFDADPESVATSLVPESAADLGDRLVIAPQELNSDITHDEVRAAAKKLSGTRNVVVLVPSFRQAALWQDVADLRASKANEISAAVARLNAGHVGLVVIVNRYDGIDLPDEACRLLIIDNLPFAYSGIERREAVALRDSEAMVTRQLQRLEQGMGRGVRSRDDRCAVIILGSRLTQLIARKDVAERLSPATRAQLTLSRNVARELEGAGVDDLFAVISQVIEGDPHFRTLSREALVGVTYGPAILAPSAPHLRKAYNAAISGRSSEAAEHSRRAVEAARNSGDTKLAGWLGETSAMYMHQINVVGAQAALLRAIEENPAILRPLAGLSYRKIEATKTQATRASKFLTETYADGQELIIGVDALLSQITWDNYSTDDAESAIADLGRHLGFVAQEPEREFGVGPDALWALGGNAYAVIEAKTGSTAEMIWKKDINQLAGSVNWCAREYGNDAVIVPVIVHPSSTVQKSGTAPAGTRVVRHKHLKDIKQAVRALAKGLVQDDDFKLPNKVGEQLDQHRLTGEKIFPAYTVRANRDPGR